MSRGLLLPPHAAQTWACVQLRQAGLSGWRPRAALHMGINSEAMGRVRGPGRDRPRLQLLGPTPPKSRGGGRGLAGCGAVPPVRPVCTRWGSGRSLSVSHADRPPRATPTPAGRGAAEGKGPRKEWGLCSSLATQHLTSLPLMGARHGGALLGVTFMAGRAQVPPRGPHLLVPALPTGFLTNPGASASFPPHNSLGAQVASHLYGFVNTDETLMPDKFFRLEMLTEQLIIWEKPERPVETMWLQARQAGRPGSFSALWPVTGRRALTQAPGVRGWGAGARRAVGSSPRRPTALGSPAAGRMAQPPLRPLAAGPESPAWNGRLPLWPA